MGRLSPTGTHVPAQGETLGTGQTPNQPPRPPEWERAPSRRVQMCLPFRERGFGWCARSPRRSSPGCDVARLRQACFPVSGDEEGGPAVPEKQETRGWSWNSNTQKQPEQGFHTCESVESDPVDNLIANSTLAQVWNPVPRGTGSPIPHFRKCGIQSRGEPDHQFHTFASVESGPAGNRIEMRKQ